MIKRDIYLNKVIDFKDTPQIIKVISGVRRSGKSSLLQLYKEYLLEQNVPESSIIFINFEDFSYKELLKEETLHRYITKRLDSKGKNYIFLDEIQLVANWQKVVNSFRLNSNNDIYITGSNAALLSGSLATLLAGRYVEIKVYPLSFNEFLSFFNLHEEDKVESFNQYMVTGGMPSLIDLPKKESVRNLYLSDIVNTIIVKDIATIAQIRDVDLLKKLIEFLSTNIGKYTNASKLAGFLTSSGRKSSTETIDNYLKHLEDAFIFLKPGTFNLVGKQLMKTNSKFYIVDIGLRNAIIGSSTLNYGSSLENIIYIELLRRDFKVTTGRFKEWEVDFIAEKQTEKLYIQVTTSILDEKTLDRETRSLKAINDNYPKLILTMDKLPYSDLEGIKVINIIDFLLGSFV